MVVRGGPLTGIDRATAYARKFAWGYWFSGSVFLPLGSLILADLSFSGCIAGFSWVLHTLSLAIVAPGAIVINFVVFRLFPSRSRRSEIWRPWLAGVLAAPAVWAGPYFGGSNWHRPPAELISSLGRDMAEAAQVLGLIIAASSAVLLVAWALPPWTRIRRRRHPAVGRPIGPRGPRVE